jgi:uncharacterized protein (TIGR02453 family)
MAKGAYFTPELFRFLRELAAHNDRDWFMANKTRYEESVRDPFLRFLVDLAPRLAKVSPQFVVDPRPVGGSMMRIYRDTRFAKDKSPYKTAVMAHFGHKKGKEGATPAFYLRLEPGHSIAGGGIWRPETPALKRIRTAIVDDTAGWKKIRKQLELRAACQMAGESLKRPPPGFDAEHEFIEDIKRKDFATTVMLDEGRVGSAAFLDDVVRAYAATAPMMAFLSKAVGLPF